MGTTRIKVIDLSSDKKETKTSRKRAEKLSALGKSKAAKKQEVSSKPSSPSSTDTTSVTDSTDFTDSTDLTGHTDRTDITDSTDLTDSTDSPKPSAPSAKKRTIRHRGSKYLRAKNAVEDKNYTLADALNLLPETSYTKFDPTVEIHLTIANKNAKVNVAMPYLKVEKKPKKYLVFGDKQATAQGADVTWASDKTIGEIENGIVKPNKDFDVVLASPKYMPALAKVAKILGPKGLMPNPKNGTVTDNFEKFFNPTDTATTTIKGDPEAPILHTKIGKLSQKPQELEANLKALVSSIGAAKIQKATLTTTMGPAIKLDTTTLN